MAYVVSHDLRQPLTQVVRSLDQLADGAGTALGAGERELVTVARRGARRLETLVDGVESYARIATGGAPEPVALEPLLGRVLDRLADERAQTRAEITHDPLPTIEASAPQIEQLLQNLLANALKFHGERPPRVHVGFEPQGDGWHLWVRDHGIGLDPRDAERVFGLFQRLHTESEYPGSGIGLALCRRIVERHGGRIWVEGRPGKGATFHVTLPRAALAGSRATNGES
jgi:signal transduction histidine kinase